MGAATARSWRVAVARRSTVTAAGKEESTKHRKRKQTVKDGERKKKQVKRSEAAWFEVGSAYSMARISWLLKLRRQGSPVCLACSFLRAEVRSVQVPAQPACLPAYLA